MLTHLPGRHLDEVHRRWFETIVATYPPQAGTHLLSGKDQFRNPTGHVLREGARELLEVLAAGGDEAAFRAPLEGMLKIRAVQDFTATEAVEFVFTLKPLVRSVLTDRREPVSGEELAQFDARVDRLALAAFSLYVECRERICTLRANELRSRTHLLLERTGYFSPPTEKEKSGNMSGCQPDGTMPGACR